MILSSEYTTNNLHLIRQLIGQEIRFIIRLTQIKPEEQLRLELGSLLLETYQGIRLYIDVDEGQGNIVLFDAGDENISINRKISEFTYKSQIYPENKFWRRLQSFLSASIDNIEIISRSDEIKTFFTMCGFKLTFSNGKSLYIGSYLTDLRLPEICILFPEEVEDNLIHQTLTSFHI